MKHIITAEDEEGNTAEAEFETPDVRIEIWLTDSSTLLLGQE